MFIYLLLFLFYCLLIFIWLYLFLAVLGLRCCKGFSLVMAIGGYSLVAVRGLLIAVASLIAEQGFWSTSSVLVARGLSSSTACGVFSNQGSNPCLLLWQADSLPLSHQGSPDIIIFLMVVFIFGSTGSLLLLGLFSAWRIGATLVGFSLWWLLLF